MGGNIRLQHVALTLLAQRGIEVDGTVDNRVAGSEVGHGVTILQISLQTYIVDVFLVVVKVMDGGLGIEPGTRFEEVGAETLGREVGIDGLKSCARQELTEVQVVDTALGIIGHQTLVEVRLQRGTGLS